MVFWKKWMKPTVFEKDSILFEYVHVVCVCSLCVLICGGSHMYRRRSEADNGCLLWLISIAYPIFSVACTRFKLTFKMKCLKLWGWRGEGEEWERGQIRIWSTSKWWSRRDLVCILAALRTSGSCLSYSGLNPLTFTKETMQPSLKGCCQAIDVWRRCA